MITEPAGGTLIQDVPLSLDRYEPDAFYGVWQFPEGRFTHFGVGPPGTGTSWLMLCSSKSVADIYIGFDALDNGRTAADYESRRLSLPEAFDEVRKQELPIVYSTGDIYHVLRGVAIFDLAGARFAITDLIPL